MIDTKALWQEMIVCSYHTFGPYCGESARLQKSLDDLDIPHDILCDKQHKGLTWREAVGLKPWAIRTFTMQYPDKPILFVDADAVFHKDPRHMLPNTWKDKSVAELPPLSVHTFGGRMCSGTVICAPGMSSFDALADWGHLDINTPKIAQPQSLLHEVEGVDGELAPTWCWIFDLSLKRFGPAGYVPIIEHFQASREFRDDRKSSPQLIESRKKRLEEYDGESSTGE